MLTGEVKSQVDAIWNAFWSGGIPGFKAAGTWRFRRVDIEHWIKREASSKKDKKS